MDNEKKSSDEIDLGALLNRIGDGFSRLWMNFVRLIATIRRVPIDNKISFSVIIIASIGIGILYGVFLKKPYYETTMVLSSDHFNNRLVNSMIDKLNQLAREKEKATIARVLNLRDSLARNILYFEAEPFVSEKDLIELEILKEQLRNAQLSGKNDQVIGQVIKKIEIENRNAFQITVRTAKAEVIPNLQEALVTYFRSNPYIRKRIEITRTNLEDRKKKLTSELEKMDSLKVALFLNYQSMAQQNRQGSNNVILSDKAGNPVEIFKEDISIYNELEIVNHDLYLQPDFEIVDGFTEFSEPASASMTTVILYSIIIGIAVAYIDVTLRGLNTYLSKIE